MTERELVSLTYDLSEKSFEKQIGLLRSFCSINCGSRNVEGNRQVVALVDAVLRDMGAAIEHVDMGEFGTGVVGRIRPENPTGRIILNAHLDTAFFTERVEEHPFHIEGEYAWGLGAADCKGGVTTILYGVKNAAEAGLLPNKEIVMLFNADEEVGSPEGQKIFRREAAGAEAVFCFEPGRNKNGVLTFRRGLADGHIRVQGIAAHAGLDSGPGASATRELANLVMRLTDRSDLSVAMNYNVVFTGGSTNPCMVADRAEAEFMVPIDSMQVYERVKKDVAELPTLGIVPGCKIETDVSLMFPPMERTEKSLVAYRMVQESAALMGLDLPEERSSNPADCSFFAGYGVPVVDGLGPYMYDIHTVGEHMRLATLRERTQLLELLLARMR